MSEIWIPNIFVAIPRNPIMAVGLPVVLGFISHTPSSKPLNSNWYYSLKTPPGLPPREVFPFVWTLLHLSIGYASHVAVKALDNPALAGTNNDLTLGIALYYAQLGLNCIWSPLFFGGHNIGLAMIDNILLTVTSCAMMKYLDRPTNAKATYFLLPYCAWLTYATYLNCGIWWLNKG